MIDGSRPSPRRYAAGIGDRRMAVEDRWIDIEAEADKFARARPRTRAHPHLEDLRHSSPPLRPPEASLVPSIAIARVVCGHLTRPSLRDGPRELAMTGTKRPRARLCLVCRRVKYSPKTGGSPTSCGRARASSAPSAPALGRRSLLIREGQRPRAILTFQSKHFVRSMQVQFSAGDGFRSARGRRAPALKPTGRVSRIFWRVSAMATK
jgi:hypothetical protein